MTKLRYELMDASYTRNGSKSFLMTSKKKTKLITKHKLKKLLMSEDIISSNIKNMKCYNNGIIIIFLSSGQVRVLGKRIED